MKNDTAKEKQRKTIHGPAIRAILATETGRSMSYQAIADEVGCSKSTVIDYYHKLIGKRRKGTKYPTQRRDVDDAFEQAFPERPGDWIANRVGIGRGSTTVTDPSPDRIARIAEQMKQSSLARYRRESFVRELEREDRQAADAMGADAPAG